MKIENKCRVCSGKQSLINVLEPENIELVEILKVCANIEVSNYWANLLNSYNLKAMHSRSLSRLIQMISYQNKSVSSADKDSSSLIIYVN